MGAFKPGAVKWVKNFWKRLRETEKSLFAGFRGADPDGREGGACRAAWPLLRIGEKRCIDLVCVFVAVLPPGPLCPP